MHGRGQGTPAAAAAAAAVSAGRALVEPPRSRQSGRAAVALITRPVGRRSVALSAAVAARTRPSVSLSIQPRRGERRRRSGTTAPARPRRVI